MKELGLLLFDTILAHIASIHNLVLSSHLKIDAEHFSIALLFCEIQYSSSYCLFRSLINQRTHKTNIYSLHHENELETRGTQILDYLSYVEKLTSHIEKLNSGFVDLIFIEFYN